MFKIGDMVKSLRYPDRIGKVTRIIDFKRVLIKILFSNYKPEIGRDVTEFINGIELIELGKAYFVPNNTHKVNAEEKTCICTGHTLLHKGCKCGAVIAKKWGLGA